MRLLLTIMALTFFSLNAENVPKAALTAGSESLTPGSGTPKSITETLPEYPETYYSTPRNEAVLQQGSALIINDKKNNSFKDIAILIAGILIAIAIYLISKRDPVSRNFEPTGPLFENENERELKAEMWDELATEQNSGENQNEQA